MTMNIKNKLLWIPRSLLIMVSLFYLYLVYACIVVQHAGLGFFFLVFLILAALYIGSFFLSTTSGVILLLISIYLLFSAKGFNGFIHYPNLILLFTGLLMVAVSVFFKTNSNSTSGEAIQSNHRQNKSIDAILLSGFLVFSLIFISFITVRFSFASPGTASGSSMIPTIHDHAFLLINRIAYRYQHPKRGDIIEFSSDQFPDLFLIKRVIGLPGDTIEWKDYHIYLNGKELIEPHQFDSFTKTYKQTNEFPSVTLKEDEYFVMGDNRMVSYDARHFDPIKREAILGKVYFIYNPPEE